MKKIISIVLCLASIISVFTPLSVNADEKITIRILKEKLAAEQAKYDANQAKINYTQDEINSKNKKIESLKDEMVTISKEVDKLKQEIEKYKVDIKDKVIESRSLIEQLQVNQGNNNLYYDYIFNASSISDMVYRTAVIKEIMDYNEKAIETLNNMIDDNKKREEEIAARKEEINKLEAELKNEVEALGQEKNSLSSGGLSIQQQLNQISKTIKSYQDLGCKLDDVVGKDCAVTASTGVWRRPTTTGYVTQNAYYNSPSSSHRGMDISSSNGRGEKIYPVLDGRIKSIYYDGYGAKCVQMEHYVASEDRYYTSLYVHLSSWSPNIYEEKYVTSDEYLGYMGDTGYAFGVHLHLELYPCRLYGDSNCIKWIPYENFAYAQLKNGYNPRQKVPVTNGLYNKWTFR